MLTVGVAPFLECSTAGDKRFSPFYAIVDGKSIEDRYHAFKIMESSRPVLFGETRRTGLGWREAKRLAKAGWVVKNPKRLKRLYARLWDQYMRENSELLPIITRASGLSDRFGQKTALVCQATELWRIRNLTLRGEFP